MSSKAELLNVRDYMAVPEEFGVQLIEGGLVMEPTPTLFHQGIVGNILVMLTNHVRKRRLGKVYTSPVGVFLDEHNVLAPDVLFVSNDNLGILQKDGAHGGPDLVVEVLSPSTARIDARKKRDLYARHGVKELWLVDPILLQIQRFDFLRDRSKPVQLFGEKGTFKTAVLPGLVIRAAEVFRS